MVEFWRNRSVGNYGDFLFLKQQVEKRGTWESRGGLMGDINSWGLTV